MALRRALAVSCLLLAAPAPAGAAEQVIAPGVRAGGVDVGGQTIESAATTLRIGLEQRLTRPITVRASNRRFRLTASGARLRFDALRTAKRAYYAGRDKGPGQEVDLALTWSARALRAFSVRVDRAVSRAPRNPSVRITLRHMRVRRGRSGKTINEISLARRLALTLGDPGRPRVLRARMNRDRPSVTMAGLRRRYATVVTVDRRAKRLRLFKRLRIRRRYGIAVGAAGFDTPSGLFAIQSKQVNPAWHVPNSPWAGSLRGRVIPGGAPSNPLKARWLGVNGSVGIHGTAEEWSIGSRASHGCIRMRVRDVIDLYRRVPMGTPVLIR
jgi:L,D-transpeptidase catalytic domain